MMPFEVNTVEQKRQEFVERALRKEKNMSALCAEYGISRPTGYKWLRRYEMGDSLSDMSRAPKHIPHKITKEVEGKILQKRTQYPEWGPSTLKRLLENEGIKDLPSRTTFANVLKRNNYVEMEKSKPRKPPLRFEREHPNDLWQVDFKGHFAMTNGDRCYPLTVLDDCTRYSLCLDAKSNEQGSGVFKSFSRLFAEFGLPKDILCDNGHPWGNSKNGYTPFEIWLMQLGILPIHIRPYRPQTQGKEERFHRTLDKELIARQQIEDIVDAQEKFDQWRHTYNHIRPHHALNLDVPADHYKPSLRTVPTVLKEPEYSGANVIKVDYKGYIRIQGIKYYFSESFASKYVQLQVLDDHIISINYGDFSIARVNTYEGLIVSKRIRRKV